MKPSTRYRIANSRAPKELSQRVGAMINTGIAGKGIMRGDTLRDLVERHCPEVQTVAAEYGYHVEMNLPENTHEALCAGEGFYLLKRSATRH